MKPLNSNERSKALKKVVGLFVLSFVIAMVLGFSTMNVNNLSDSKSNRDLKKIQSQLKYQAEVFAPNIDKVTKIIAKIPVSKKEGENIDLLNRDIANILSTTKNSIPPLDESSKMYQNILKVYSDMQVAYNDQLKLSDELESNKNNTQGSDKELSRCLDEKKALQNEIAMMKLAGGGGGSSPAGGGGNASKLEKDLKDAKSELEKCNLINKALKTEVDRLRSK